MIKRPKSCIGRGGYTLTELMLALLLLSVAIVLISASLSPAARMVKKMEDLNNAQIVADGVLETIKSQLENAQEYVKCYNGEANIANKSGLSAGNIIEFKNSDGYAVVISADGCEQTTLQRPSGVVGSTDGIEKGYLIMRYYRYKTENKYQYKQDGKCVARAYTPSYTPAFYMGFKVDIGFVINTDTVDVTVIVHKGNVSEPVITESIVVDMRYSPEFSDKITAMS